MVKVSQSNKNQKVIIIDELPEEVRNLVNIRSELEKLESRKEISPSLRSLISNEIKVIEAKIRKKGYNPEVIVPF